MAEKSHKSLRAYAANLLAAGRVTFSGEEAEKELGLPHTPFLKSARRLRKQGKLISPRSGFHVIVPPQFLNLGAPPPSWYIDDLMRHEQHPYYVGLLKAAELHDASHQATMEFQVVTEARLPRLRAGRSVITFHYRQKLAEFADGIEDRKTDTGKMRISSLELTALDLVRYPHAAGGLENILTVLGELGARLDGGKLAVLCPKFECSVRQRLGYLCARAGYTHVADVIHASITNDRMFRWVELDPAEAAGDADLALAPVGRDARWRLVIRREPEADEQ